MQCKADKYMCVVREESFIHILSHACFSRTSFCLCLLQQNVHSQVCASKTPSYKLPDFSKEPLSFHFNSVWQNKNSNKSQFPMQLDHQACRKHLDSKDSKTHFVKFSSMTIPKSLLNVTYRRQEYTKTQTLPEFFENQKAV